MATPTAIVSHRLAARMSETDLLHRRLDDQAVACVLDHLHASRSNGRFLFLLAELTEDTALDPNTVESVMRLLERTGPFDVEAVENGYGETRWTVHGSAYDLNGWTSDAWNVPPRFTTRT